MTATLRASGGEFDAKTKYEVRAANLVGHPRPVEMDAVAFGKPDLANLGFYRLLHGRRSRLAIRRFDDPLHVRAAWFPRRLVRAALVRSDL